jgi:hypothetical protein
MCYLRSRKFVVLCEKNSVFDLILETGFFFGFLILVFRDNEC